MVMEPLPSPGSAASSGSSRVMHPATQQLNPHFLGREFVRQYYTLLNQSPTTLYRFYADDSSLVHGSLGRNGENEPVYGQTEIQRRIMSLNFRDCRAKIQQVDSLETLERGVVVQVSGELSNNGLPMRRFFQTFVLAPRSPTNYYVRNEIFRYQDEAFIDEEDCADMKKVDLEFAAKAVIESTMSPPEPVIEQPKQVNGHSEAKSLRSPDLPLPADPTPIVVPVKEEPPQLPVTISGPAAKVSQSWAARVADSGVLSQPLPPHRPAEASVPVLQTSPAAVATAAGATPPKQGKDARRSNRPKMTKPDKSDTPIVTGAAAEPTNDIQPEDKKTAVTYGDEQQVFVGNLPQDISEDELRKIFSKYGSIVDVRINRTNQKSSAGRTPNYGFVTFEDTKIVKSILSQKPIYYNEHRFNVEEKRSQGRGGNLNRSLSGGGLNTSRGTNAIPDSKVQRAPRGGDRKDGPRDRPFADRNERLSGDSSSGHGVRKSAGGGAAGGTGNNNNAATGGPMRQPFHNNSKR